MHPINIQAIKDFMKQNNLSKAKFCRQCKIGSSVYEKIMAKHLNIKISILNKIADAINLKHNEFFNYDPKKDVLDQDTIL